MRKHRKQRRGTLGIGLQEQVSNRLKLPGSRVPVVNVLVKKAPLDGVRYGIRRRTKVNRLRDVVSENGEGKSSVQQSTVKKLVGNLCTGQAASGIQAAWRVEIPKKSGGTRPLGIPTVAKARQRCWKHDWVIDLDIKGFFDTIDHELIWNDITGTTPSSDTLTTLSSTGSGVGTPTGECEEPYDGRLSRTVP